MYLQYNRAEHIRDQAFMRDGDSPQFVPRWQTILEVSILAVALLISALIILQGDGVVPKPFMDQHFVGTVDLHLRREDGHFVFQYPNLMHAGGITSSLLAGLYKLIIPTTPGNLNWHFKIFAMASCLLSSFFCCEPPFHVFSPCASLAF